MTDAENVETPEVSFSLSGDTLTLRDEAGGGEVLVELDGDTSLTRATTSWFDVPMDAAVSFEVEGLRFPNIAGATLRRNNGDSYDILSDTQTTVSESAFIDISASLKLVAYIEEGPVRATIVHGADEATLVEFDDPTRVVLGTRSFHEEPTATITVPDDPAQLMQAVSHLGSSVKEWSPERSWPTLRGHPPAMEAGETLDIPDRLTVPDTGVTVSVPETIADVFRAAPLAYYFGATVVPGKRAELRLGSEHVEGLGSGQGLEQSVDQLLARGLVLDSLARVGGYYSLHRYEYDELAPDLPFYPPKLYDEPINRQLLEYLEIPFSMIEPYVPRWSTTLTLAPKLSEVEALPYSLAALSRVRVTSDGRPRPTDHKRSVQLTPATRVSTGVASVQQSPLRVSTTHQRRLPADADVLIVGAADAVGDCFTRTEWTNYDIDGPVPTPERVALPTRTALADALTSDRLYLHFGGDVTPDGFVCCDGLLGFEETPSPSVGAVSFGWNSPETAAPARLFDASTIGCLSTEPFPPAVAEAFAKYLVLGYSPWQAARFVGWSNRARFCGDASRSLVDNVNGNPPALLSLEETQDGRYRVVETGWSIKRDWLGAVARAKPDPAESEFMLMGGMRESRRKVPAESVQDLADGDHLLRFQGEVPDEVPIESVVHTSRPDWPYGSDVAEPERKSPTSRR